MKRQSNNEYMSWIDRITPHLFWNHRKLHSLLFGQKNFLRCRSSAFHCALAQHTKKSGVFVPMCEWYAVPYPFRAMWLFSHGYYFVPLFLSCCCCFSMVEWRDKQKFLMSSSWRLLLVFNWNATISFILNNTHPCVLCTVCNIPTQHI